MKPKPLRVGCTCGNIVGMVGCILFANHDIHFFGMCAACGQCIKFETSLDQLRTKCDQIGEVNQPLIPPTREFTEEDVALLKSMNILPEGET